MAHALQDRYANIVDMKIRASLMTPNGIVFNTRYQGVPTAGKVQIPVRDTEVSVRDYTISSGLDIQEGTTSYLPMDIDKAKGVNELIDGYEAAAVPDNLVADRLDSAGYGLALQLDLDGIATLEAGGTSYTDTTPMTATTAYDTLVDIRTALRKANVPNDRLFALVSPDVVGFLLKDTEHFIRASELGDAVVQSGIIGKIAGFMVIEGNNMSATTEVIAGHPDWCHRVNEWDVLPNVKDLANEFIGASAVQGRMVYGHLVSKAAAVIVKSNA